jgi:hypothetical protein
LTRLTRTGIDFVFSTECLTAFEELKRRLVEAPILSHYYPHRESKLETDASDGVVAGVLSQKGDDEEWHPIAYFSKTMTPAELNYQVHDKEMLAIVKSLNYRTAS